jgi:hypothetical protein
VTLVPLPASPCLRVRLVYDLGSGLDAGQRLYFSYSGSAPTGANCTTLASDIQGAWSSHLAALISADLSLTEIDVLDIATDSGLSGQWSGSVAGSRSGTPLPNQVCTNIEFNIARRYRGGKPRTYLPAGLLADEATNESWSSAYITAVNAGFAAFISEVEGLSVGAIGTLAHVNLSYYKGFTNIVNSSGRERAVPTYRSVALVDTITGYSTKALMGSQKRRRSSTTP